MIAGSGSVITDVITLRDEVLTQDSVRRNGADLPNAGLGSVGASLVLLANNQIERMGLRLTCGRFAPVRSGMRFSR